MLKTHIPLILSGKTIRGINYFPEKTRIPLILSGKTIRGINYFPPELTIDEINKNAQAKASAANMMIEKAIASSRLVLLTLQEFMDITKMNVDQYVVDKFYHSIKDDIPIYIDNTLIKWCGFEGELRNQKQNLLKLINKHNIKTTEMSNEEYEQFWCSQPTAPETNIEIYPDPKTFSKKATTTKHILIMPDDFKMIVMRLPTKKGELVCRYYIELEKMIKQYLIYQTTFLVKREELLEIELKESRAEREADRKKADAEYKKSDEARNKADEARNKAEERGRRLEEKIDNITEELEESNETITELNDDVNELLGQLDTATDDRVPKTVRVAKREKFVLMRLNDEDPTTHDFRVIRAQHCNINRAKSKILALYPNANVALSISCQPNSANLYIRIKEQLANVIMSDKNYISPDGITCADLIQRIKQINRAKKNV